MPATAEPEVQIPLAFGFLFDPPLGALRYRVVYGGRGSAKCLALGTRIIMADGTLRSVESIRRGEQVMGPDSSPRTVLAITRGSGPLYRVRQTSGIDYVVNSDHLLSVKKSESAKADIRVMASGNPRSPHGRYPGWSDVVTLRAPDFALQSPRWQSHFRGYRAGVLRFPERAVGIDPYFLGIWLGDGHSRELRITSADPEIVGYCRDLAIAYGGDLSVKPARRGKAITFGLVVREGRENPIWRPFKKYGLANRVAGITNNKHIPHDYLANSESVRLALLAGLLDSDGYLARNGYLIVQVNERLARQIKYLADTLGFRTNIAKRRTVCGDVRGWAWAVSINGDTWRIPCILPRKRVARADVHKNKDWRLSQLTVEPVGEGEWAGFTLDGDQLFLLEDGTVTHNSWQCARALLLHGAQAPLRILCAREYQSSIRDSVHKLLSDQIETLGLSGFYMIQQTGIFGTNGTEFLFKGMRRDVAEIKSTEGIDLCWVEEAEAVSEESWRVLIPTIRKPGSEIWVSFNPALATDPTYRTFIEDPPARALVRRVGYRDNPWLPDVLAEEARELQRRDPEAYANVWDGEPWTRSDAEVLAGKWQIKEFEPTASWQGPYYGADWGFARDPSVLVRIWLADSRLWLEYEAGGVQLDMDETLSAFQGVPGAGDHVIRADSARPETINEMRRRGLRVEPCEKWDGSVKDGIEHLRSYEAIIIHPRCKRAIQEARLWRYKADPRTGDVLPKLLAGNEHSWDAVRYALGPMIRHAPEFTPVRVRMG